MKIVVNGVVHDWPDPGQGGFRAIAYEDIADLAYPGRYFRQLTMTYHWCGPGDIVRSGMLWPGSKAVVPAEGMKFSAVHTGNA